MTTIEFLDLQNKRLSELEKENEELKEDLQTAVNANKKWLQRDTQLEEENAELKAKIEAYKETLSFEKDVIQEGLFTQLKEAEAKIEKMKCCETCRWYNNMECDCHNLNKWELSE